MRLRRKLLVRLHVDKLNESIEGVWSGTVGGHYLLTGARLITTTSGQPTDLGLVRVPTPRVLFLQVVHGDQP
jgi:hypothetical protein